MQRLLSFATIALVVGAGWLFLQETPPSGQAPADAAPQLGSGTSAPPPSHKPHAVNSARTGTRPSIRIASFNIESFGEAQEKNLAVMQTLAAIIKNFDVVAIQEIRIDDDYLLERFVNGYLNPLSRRAYDYCLGPRLGRSTSKEQYAYIYDTNRIQCNRNHIYTIRDPDDLLHREPFVAMFRARGPQPQEAFTFVLVNVHTDPDQVESETNSLAKVYHAVREAAGGEDDIIVLGDFNADDQSLGQLGKIPNMLPLVTGTFTNTRQTKQYDNILIHRPSTAEFTGRAGVYDMLRLHNLTMEQSLQVSDHVPVWAEFQVYESAAPGRVATRPLDVSSE